MTDYPLLARKLLVTYKCPQCNKIAKTQIENLPSPNWDGDTVGKSTREENYEFNCQYCKLDLEADVYANIYYGELRIHKMNSWKEVEILDVREEIDEQDYIRLRSGMKTDLDIFLERGNDFKRLLERIVLYACYYSAKYDIPFSVSDIIEERDDYRYDFMCGFLSAICFLKSPSDILCSKVALPSYLGSEVYVVCKKINDNILNTWGISTTPFSIIKGINNVKEYFILQRQRNNIGKYYYIPNPHHNKYDVYSTSLNDDIILYSLKYACYKQIQELPINLITTSTPYYNLVEAYGFVEYLNMVNGNHFECDIDTSDNIIKNIKIDDFFDDYTRGKLVEKYERNQMYIDDVFDMIESKINDYCTLVKK